MRRAGNQTLFAVFRVIIRKKTLPFLFALPKKDGFFSQYML